MRALRRKIMVVVAVFTVAVAGLALARSLPFADRSQPPTTRNATQAAATPKLRHFPALPPTRRGQATPRRRLAEPHR